MTIKSVFIDISGVLYVGNTVVDGAVDAIQRLQHSEIEVRFLTNTSRQTRQAIYENFLRLGFDCSLDQIHTAPSAAIDWMRQNGKRPYCLLHPDILPEFAGLDQHRPNAVVIGDAADELSYANLNRAFRLCLDGAPLIGIGRNRYFKLNDEFLLDAGPFIAAIEYAADVEAVIMGKPSVEFFAQVVSSINCQGSEVLMIGDDVYGDVEGALNAGLQACLVQTGKYRSGDEHLIEGQFEVRPSIAEAIQDLVLIP